MSHNIKPKVGNVEVMQASIEGVRDGLLQKDVAERLGVERSRVSECYTILRANSGLAEQVLSGELTVYKAHQIATKGTMHRCPICKGAGYVFRKAQ